ncbi:organic cation transporter protein-like [Schistocerca americana]|uniref:organic cation transporter protein-like n=1 Tax=Schistocerca americana TaxID=7009 RepID=UPI001F4F4769|nr:organic cation transporter protein-like [Schistocerca americana]
MNEDELLEKAGECGCFQFRIIATFAVVNILSAFHYFGPTFLDMQEAGFESVSQEEGWSGMAAWGQSAFFAGCVLGTLSLGAVADRAGRRLALLVAWVLAAAGNGLAAAAHAPPLFVLGRAVAGLATDTNFFMMYILVMEYMGERWRTAGLNATVGVFYGVGCAAAPWLALGCGGWPLLFLLLPESARWLLQAGRPQRAAACYRSVAAANGRLRHLPHDLVERLQEMSYKITAEAAETSASVFGLLKTPVLRRRTLILVFKSMVLTLCYDATWRDVNDLGFPAQVVFSASAATILPACLIILWLQDRVGRKALSACALSLCAAAVALPDVKPGPAAALALALLSRLAINVAYNAATQYAAELLPTQVRGQGVSAVHVCGYAAGAASAHVVALGPPWRGALLSLLCAAGAALCLLLPETLHRQLPRTLRDAEAFGADETCCLFAWTIRRRQQSPPQPQPQDYISHL